MADSPPTSLYTTSREMISRPWMFKLNDYFKVVYHLAKIIITHGDGLGPIEHGLLVPHTATSHLRNPASWDQL